MNILIDGPKTLVIQPQHLATILDCLANAPFRVAQPIIEDLMRQVTSAPGAADKKVADGSD